jgi:anti-sigma factor RsiW
MSVLSFESRQCDRVRRQLDAYLSDEVLVETTSEVLKHLENCEACAREAGVARASPRSSAEGSVQASAA